MFASCFETGLSPLSWVASCALLGACLPVNDLASYSAGGADQQGPGRLPAFENPPASENRKVESDGGWNASDSGDWLDADPPGRPAEEELEGSGTTDEPDAKLEAIAAGSVASQVPPDGARGVRPDVALVINFAQAMSRDTLPEAVETEGIPLTMASFEWSEDSRTVRITLAQPLEEAQGTDPSSVEPLCYSYRVSEAARDVFGQPIHSSRVSFCTRRRISRVVSPVLDRNVTGHWRGNDTYGIGDCARSGTRVCVGDSGRPNSQYRGFLTFDSGLFGSASIDGLTAQLRLQFSGVQGNPVRDLGNLFLEQVQFDAIGFTSFVQAPIRSIDSFRPVSDSGLTWSADVALAVQAPQIVRSQFRLRFGRDTDSDDLSDQYFADWTSPELRLEYTLP
jgi:hypothetical protein